MNWIEIDQILYRMIEQYTSAEDVYRKAEKQFKWNRKQTQDAVDPLLKRHTELLNVAKPVKNPSKKLRNR